MVRSRRAHRWVRVAADVDGDEYQYCARRNCGVIWSHMHNQESPEPVGCQGDEETRPAPNRQGRRHLWKGQRGVDQDAYFYCRRTNCGVIWSPAHDGNRPEPWGCQGQDPPQSPRARPTNQQR